MRARLVNLGVGMSHMPVLFESVFPELRRMPGTELAPGPWLWLLLHTDLRKTVRVRRFVDFLTEEMHALHKNKRPTTYEAFERLLSALQPTAQTAAKVRSEPVPTEVTQCNE